MASEMIGSFHLPRVQDLQAFMYDKLKVIKQGNVSLYM